MNAGMAEQSLYDSQIRSFLQHVGCRTVPKGSTWSGFSHRACSLAGCAEVVAVNLLWVRRDSSVIQFNLRLILAFPLN